MIQRLSYAAIWFLDWIVDVRLLKHRFHGYCCWVSDLWERHEEKYSPGGPRD